MALERCYFAGGCFWGVQYHFEKLKGVEESNVGYCGGVSSCPTYEEVCTGKSLHAETLEIVFDPRIVSFSFLAREFFQIHDPTQSNRQGPDVGNQYRSEIFYMNPQQKIESQKLIDILKDKGLKVETKLTEFEKFWKAEDYHQHYYITKGQTPYCHTRKNVFL